uniref:Uroplakin 3B n=1 Tax=Ursus americanus TaxID=9643 RepID=A0A452QQB4_URSAM
RMTVWLISLMSMKILLLAEPSLSFHIEPEEGSLAGGTWITVIFDGWESELLYPTNGSQLEIYLVNVAVPALPSIPCDVSPAFLDLPVLTCRTRSLLSEAHEGLYYLEVHSGGQVGGSPSPGPRDNCTFKSTSKSPLRALTGLNNSQKVYQAAGGCGFTLLILCVSSPPSCCR